MPNAMRSLTRVLIFSADIGRLIRSQVIGVARRRESSHSSFQLGKHMVIGRKTAKPRFLSSPTFDEVVCGHGDSQQRFSFHEFCELPLSRRVALLLEQPRYFREGRLINGSDAMTFGG